MECRLQPSLQFRRVRQLISSGAVKPTESETPIAGEPAVLREAVASAIDQEELAEEEEEAERSDEYSKEMQSKMGGDLVYCHEAGINYHKILPDLYVGSCLQTAADVDLVAEELGVSAVICLQQDSDMDYFQLDIQPIQARCKERGDIQHIRVPIRDFDPFSLRTCLPDAVRAVCQAAAGGKTVYIHCTAGLGRAPAVAMAWMYWCKGFELTDAVNTLVGIRRCNPKVQSIRQATVDVLFPEAVQAVTIALANYPPDSSVQIAGLDVGWGQLLDMKYDAAGERFVLQRELRPGLYQYKFVVDGEWMYDQSLPSIQDGSNINNVAEVLSPSRTPQVEAAMDRLLSESGTLTAQERECIMERVCGHRPSLVRQVLRFLQAFWPLRRQQ